MMNYDSEKKKWEVDRHIPLAVLFTIFLQTMGIVIWAARFTATTETRLDALESQVDHMANVNERLAKLEITTANNAELLREIRTAVIEHERRDRR